jgi:transcriptional regulator with XRE-family HTH domain
MGNVTPQSEAFGARLEAVRRYHGRRTGRPRIRCAEFADEIGVLEARYRRWERGEREPPLFALDAIRRVTGLSLDWLISDLAPGDVIIPHLGVATPGDRLRWAREITCPSSSEAARVMSIPTDHWAAYESGRTPIPLSVAQEFCHRFSVSLDYLYSGRMEGVHSRIRDVLLERRPQLLARAPVPRTVDEDGRDIGRAMVPGRNDHEADPAPTPRGGPG